LLHVIRLKLFTLFLAFASFLFALYEYSSGQIKPDIQFKQIGQITGNQNHFLGAPVDIKVIDGQIFIGDLMDLKIKVFSIDGEFIREMAGRGRGPGELLHITSMWTSYDGKHINVADYLNRKVVTYSREGSLVKERMINTKISWPRTFHALSEKELLILYQPLNDKNKKIEIFHIWENDLNKHKKSFPVLSNLLEGDILKEITLGLRVGSSLVKDSKIYYAPTFFEGKIYSKDLNSDGGWASIEGVKLTGESYEYLDSGARLVNEDGVQIYDYQLNSPEGKFTYRLYHTTKALFQTNEGYIVHFVEIRDGDLKQQGIELYDESGNFITYEAYYNQELKEDRYTLILEHPKAIDENNRVYTINRKGEEPVISVYQLSVEM